MNPTNFSTYSTEEISLFFQKSSIDELKNLIPLLTSTQILTGIQTFDEAKLSKLPAIVNLLTATPLLESVGKVLTEKQFIALLKGCSAGQFNSHKLLPLLVGLPFQTFVNVIETAPQPYLEPFKNEEMLEPLQNHLNVLGHDCEKKLVESQRIGEDLFQEIHDLDIQSLNHSILKKIRTQIQSLENHYQNILDLLDKALSILWNTSRIDLLDRFSHLKESANLQYIHMIGTKDWNGHGLGLNVRLKEFLNHIFEAESIEDSVEGLKDEDLAIDGLTKLGLWYLEDYWEVGLLPNVKRREELDQHSDYQFNQVQENLGKLGIKTILDLKKANIYSKGMLKEFIQRNKMDED